MLLAVGFVLAAAAIVGGAIAIVGSLTHGFKKPVKVTYKKSAVFSLKTGDCLDPQGQSYTLIACDSPHEAEVFATFKLPGHQVAGKHRGRHGGEQRLRDPAARLPQPRARDQPRVHLRVPGRGRVEGGHPHRDLRGAGVERAADRVGARRVGDRGLGPVSGLAVAGRAGDAGTELRVVDDAVRAVAHHGAEVDEVPVTAPGDKGSDTERVRDSAFPVHDS